MKKAKVLGVDANGNGKGCLDTCFNGVISIYTSLQLLHLKYMTDPSLNRHTHTCRM